MRISSSAGLALAVLLPLSSALAQETPAPSEEAYLAYGEDLLSQGRGPEAKPYFEYTLQMAPGTGRAWLGLGKVAEGERRWTDAVEAYENAAKLLPGEAGLPALIQRLRQIQTPYRFSDEPGEALSMAKKRGIPVLLLFVGNEKRCAACAGYQKLIISLEDMRPLLHPFAGVLVDALWSDGKAAYYGVSKLPSLVAVAPSGKVMGRLEGEQDGAKIEAFLKSLQPRR